MKTAFSVIILLAIVFCSCGASTQAIQTAIAQTKNGNKQSTKTANAQTQVAIPTETPTLIATETPTPTSAPIYGCTAMVLTECKVFKGPGTFYGWKCEAYQGETATVIGRTRDGSWLYVTVPNCTDWIFSLRLDIDLNKCSLQEPEIPPTPTQVFLPPGQSNNPSGPTEIILQPTQTSGYP